jgi:hypothetical protein
MESKTVETFIQVTHGEPEDGIAVWLDDKKDAEALGRYFIDNLEFGETATVKRIKGTRREDPTGNYEFYVDEIKP